MNIKDFFNLAEAIIGFRSPEFSEEILFRTAINRFFYGVFHLVQKKLNIRIPSNQIQRCHAYIKEKIEHLQIRSDYMDLEAYRINADYDIDRPMKEKNYEDAAKIKQRLYATIMGEGEIPYYEENDEEFYFKNKNESL